MKKTRLTTTICIAVCAMLILFTFAGCGGQTGGAEQTSGSNAGGVLRIRVNPEIAVSYDENGAVTAITAVNGDAEAIVESYKGYEGKSCETVVTELVEKIGAAGYLVEELEGEPRKITIELDRGSVQPSQSFLDSIAEAVRICVSENNWSGSVSVSDYGLTDYATTDYGYTDYGVTDYGYTDYGAAAPTAAAAATTQPTTAATTANRGNTDYGNTDYGNTDYGVTDYGYTDYGAAAPTTAAAATTQPTTAASAANRGNTDYGVTDYGNTDYGNTDYGNTDYGNTDYGNTDYGNTDYGITDYD